MIQVSNFIYGNLDKVSVTFLVESWFQYKEHRRKYSGSVYDQREAGEWEDYDCEDAYRETQKKWFQGS